MKGYGYKIQTEKMGIRFCSFSSRYHESDLELDVQYKEHNISSAIVSGPRIGIQLDEQWQSILCKKKSIVPAMQHGCRAKPLLASMGKAALKSHMDGTRHQAHFSASVKSVPIARSFFSREEISQVAPLTSTNDNVTEVRAVQSLPDLCTLSKKVADAEILWALKCVNSHFWSK